MTQKNIVVDIKYCIGCWACEMACKQENNVPVGIKWLNVIKVGPKMVGNRLKMDFIPMRCRHCSKAPCVEACPEDAIIKRSDGIVLIDNESCIGCLNCAEVCPFNAIQFNEQTGTVEKCTLCVHRIDAGLEPACVLACPSKCIHFGDINEILMATQAKIQNNSLSATLRLFGEGKNLATQIAEGPEFEEMEANKKYEIKITVETYRYETFHVKTEKDIFTGNSYLEKD